MILQIDYGSGFLAPSLYSREGMELVAFQSKTGELNRNTVLSRYMDKELGLAPKYKNVFKEVKL